MIQRLRCLVQLLPRPVKSWLRAMRRAVGGSPIQRVFAELERRGVPVRHSHVLEVFGGVGDLHIKDYARRVAALEIWELDPSAEARLRRNVPSAVITIGDSFKLMKESQARHDIVVVDNPVLFSATPLEIYVDSLERTTDRPVFIFTVVPDMAPATCQAWPPLQQIDDIERVLQRRRAIFQTATPEHVPLEKMAAVYGELARLHRFEMEWSFSLRRHYAHYLVFRLRRT